MERHVTTLAAATQARESAEQQVLAILRTLTDTTGLHLEAVKVVTWVQSTKNGEAQQVPHAVRITLAV